MRHQRITYPSSKDKIRFKAGFKSSKVPFVIFYDFESLQRPADKECSCDERTLAYTKADEETKLAMEHDDSLRASWERVRVRQLRPCPHRTKAVRVQTAFAYHIIALSREGEVIETREYVGDNAGSRFIDDMLDLDEILTNRMKSVVPMALSGAEQEAFEDAERCYLCDRELEDDRVRDHDHLSGAFLGAAHNVCNLRRREQKKIVAFSHNFSGSVYY